MEKLKPQSTIEEKLVKVPEEQISCCSNFNGVSERYKEIQKHSVKNFFRSPSLRLKTLTNLLKQNWNERK